MIIIYSSNFSKSYKPLPASVKTKAEKQEIIFKQNPFDPRLKTHKLTGKLQGLWAYSISYQYRIIFEFVDEDTVWYHLVGTHSIYKQ